MELSAVQSVPTSAGPGGPELAELLRVFNDVTSRLQGTHDQLRAEVSRLTRELLAANEQLERSRRLAALGEMAAGISHEVRNPLGSIGLYARMLDDDLADRPDQRKIARKIAAAAKGLDAVVGDVLTFSREFKLRADHVDAGELFDAALESCLHDGVPGWDRASVRRAPGVAVRFQADANLSRQALVNVVRNAIEAMHEAGSPLRELTLDACVRIVASAGGRGMSAAVLSVRDTGPGVDAGVLERMFNPFFTTRSTGTGLGLAIVHRIMDAHAGRVAVWNNRDRGGGPGATVELIFPERQDAAKGSALGDPHSGLAGAVRGFEGSDRLVGSADLGGSGGGPAIVVVKATTRDTDGLLEAAR